MKKFTLSFVLVLFIALLFFIVMTGGEADEETLDVLEIGLGGSIDSVDDYEDKISGVKKKLENYKKNINKLLDDYEDLQRDLDKNVKGVSSILKEIDRVDFSNLKRDLGDFNKTFADKRDEIEMKGNYDFLIIVLICFNFCFLFFIVFYSCKS